MIEVINKIAELGYSKALVLSAGPSLKAFKSDYLDRFFSDCLIVTVKQSFKVLDREPDVHFYNEYNYESCPLINSIIVTSSVKGFNGKYFKKGDLHVEIDPTLPIIMEQMSDDNLLGGDLLVRGKGPGIMYETVLPVLFKAGVKEFFVVGWDLGAIKSELIPRFYEKRNLIKSIEYFFYRNKMFYNIYLRIENKIRRALFLVGIKTVLNNPGISPNEASRIASTSGEMYDLLLSRNIALTIVSKVSLLDNRIPRWSKL